MEIRLWVPEGLAAWRYCLKHPRSFLIGGYGFNRWWEAYQRAMHWRSQFHREELKHDATRNKLIEARKELTLLKRKLSA